MKIEDYLPKKDENMKPFSVPLHANVKRRLEEIRTNKNFAVRQWIRDLITENLDELEKELAKRS